MDPLIKTAVLRTLGLLLWALLSAWLFVMVEYTEDNDADGKKQLLHSLYESMASKYNMSIDEFDNFSNVAYKALSEPKPVWTYDAAVNFIFQAITTIGYGYITPQTPTGQILYIFVSLLGIPITMLALKSVGEVIVKWVSEVVTKFETKLLKRPEPKRIQTKSAVILFALMVVLMVAGGSLTIHLSDWSLIEGVYFWFVTFTTTGFGDYVLCKPQQIRQGNNKDKGPVKVTSLVFVGIFFKCYFISGLCIVSSVLNSIMAAIEEHKCRPRCPRCVPRKNPVHVDNEENDTPEQRDVDATYQDIEL